jgi:hypothetical protein
MLKVLGENYYLDLDKIESYLELSEPEFSEFSGTQETKINIIKFEMVKILVDTLMTEGEDTDEKLGLKSSNSTSIPFRIAFNSLLNKKLINHY